MESLSAFLNMGGYAGFVWPSYAIALVVMVAVLAVSWRGVRAREAELEQIQRLRPARRRGAATEGVEE